MAVDAHQEARVNCHGFPVFTLNSPPVSCGAGGEEEEEGDKNGMDVSSSSEMLALD